MSFLDVLRTAIFALRGNWMRSALTSLGVIIGIAAVIVMVSGVYIKALGLPVVALMVREAAARASVPVALHLDHGDSFELAAACVDAGFTSVMFDGSRHAYADNVSITRRVAELAQADQRLGVARQMPGDGFAFPVRVGAYEYLACPFALAAQP